MDDWILPTLCFVVITGSLAILFTWAFRPDDMGEEEKPDPLPDEQTYQIALLRLAVDNLRGMVRKDNQLLRRLGAEEAADANDRLLSMMINTDTGG